MPPSISLKGDWMKELDSKVVESSAVITPQLSNTERPVGSQEFSQVQEFDIDLEYQDCHKQL